MGLRAFITGVGGFAGQHLARFLLSAQEDVWGMVRPGQLHRVQSLLAEARLLEADLGSGESLEQALTRCKPDLVFHLAAQTSVAQSWQDPEATYVTNVLGQLRLLEALRRTGVSSRVLVVSSAEVYGEPQELPVRETHPLDPTSPYAVSKLAQDMMGRQYFAAYGMPVVRVRPFNHIGPGQSDAFVASGFARQIAEAEAQQRAPRIQVGNLEVMRDFTDVRDVVRGYYSALTLGQAGDVYNIGSGEARPIQSLLDVFLAHSRVPVTVEQDPNRYRAIDVPCICGDSSKLRGVTGWLPSIPLESTLTDVLEYWRARVRERTSS